MSTIRMMSSVLLFIVGVTDISASTNKYSTGPAQSLRALQQSCDSLWWWQCARIPTCIRAGLRCRDAPSGIARFEVQSEEAAGCPQAQNLTTLDQCETAASAVGLAFRDTLLDSISFPAGCYVRNSIVWFNRASTGTRTDGRFPLCRATETGPAPTTISPPEPISTTTTTTIRPTSTSFEIFGVNNAECVNGLSIDIQADCEIATTELGLRWSGIVNRNIFPRGCYLKDGTDVWFNNNSRWRASGTRAPICRTTGPPTTNRPPTNTNRPPRPNRCPLGRRYTKSVDEGCQRCTCNQRRGERCRSNVRRRREVLDLSPTEFAEYARYINVLMASNQWAEIARIHGNSMREAHNQGSLWEASFLHWHRRYLYDVETELIKIKYQETGSCEDLAIPYWDWTQSDPRESRVWSAEYFGSNNADSSEGCVTNGPFARAGRNCIARGWNNNFMTVETQWRDAMVDLKTTHSVRLPNDPNGLRTFSTWRRELELLHNSVHVLIGGTMQTVLSPLDPIFFSHHAMVDKLWSEQQERGGFWRDTHHASAINLANLPHNTPGGALFAGSSLHTVHDVTINSEIKHIVGDNEPTWGVEYPPDRTNLSSFQTNVLLRSGPSSGPVYGSIEWLTTPDSSDSLDSSRSPKCGRASVELTMLRSKASDFSWYMRNLA